MAQYNVAPADVIFQFLDTNGDESGVVNAVGDYSVTPGFFHIKPAAGETYAITALRVTILDLTGAFPGAEYGALGAALTNGINFLVSAGSPVSSATLVRNLGSGTKTNAEWGAFATDLQIEAWSGGGGSLYATIDLNKAGSPIFLDGDAGQQLVIQLQDDFTGIDGHLFRVFGVKI